jgi:hypothetical protein
MRRPFQVLCSVALLTGVLAAVPLASLAQNDEKFLGQFVIASSSVTKRPQVDARDSTVHIVSPVEGEAQRYWTKTDSALTATGPEEFCPPGDVPDFSTSDISVAPNGTLWVVCTENNEDDSVNRVLVANKPVGGRWTNKVVADDGVDFPVQPGIIARSDTEIFAFWREPSRPIRYVRSTNGGSSWSNFSAIDTEEAAETFAVPALGPNGELAVAYFRGFGDDLQIYVSIWNGSGFDPVRVTTTDRSYGNPSAAYTPDGTLHVAYRSIGPGVWVSSQQSNGQWTQRRLSPDNQGDAYDLVSIDSDNAGNLHVTWAADGYVFYRFKPAGGDWSSRIVRNTSNGTYFNYAGAANISASGTYFHVVFENWSARPGPAVGYALFSAASVQPLGAVPVIDNDAPLIGDKETVTVTFKDLVGTPTEVRWRWNAAPTDTENDSGGWQAYQATLSVPVPTSLRPDDDDSCEPVTLFVQLKNAQTQGQAASDTVIIDAAVAFAARANNPNIINVSDDFTPVRLANGQAVLQDFNSDGGASDGDPGYTRSAFIYLEVSAREDCSGINTLALGNSMTNMPEPFVVDSNFFANKVAYPGTLQLGNNNPIVLKLIDKVGNERTLSTSIIYDNVKPVLTNQGAAALAVSSDPDATVLSTLTVSNATVTDNLYPAPGFWGIWVANSRTQVSSPLTDENLVWTPLETPGTTGSFTIDGWSLVTGIPEAQRTAGEYFVYVRFLDGAGNPSDAFLTDSVTLAAAPTEARVFAPIVRR